MFGAGDLRKHGCVSRKCPQRLDEGFETRYAKTV